MCPDILALPWVTIVLAQVVYWFWLRDDGRDEVVWDACLLREPKEESYECDGTTYEVTVTGQT